MSYQIPGGMTLEDVCRQRDAMIGPCRQMLAWLDAARKAGAANILLDTQPADFGLAEIRDMLAGIDDPAGLRAENQRLREALERAAVALSSAAHSLGVVADTGPADSGHTHACRARRSMCNDALVAARAALGKKA